MDDRKLAVRTFGRLIRSLGTGYRDAIVCLESDRLGDMIAAMERNYPAGTNVAVYYPAEQCFRFMEWAPGERDGGSTPIDSNVDTTIGMAIAAIEAEQSGWTARIPKFSTAEIEKQHRVRRLRTPRVRNQSGEQYVD